MAIPTEFKLDVGGDEASPVPVKLTIGPRIMAVALFALVVLAAVSVKKRGR